MSTSLVFLPKPRQIKYLDQRHILRHSALVLLDTSRPQDLYFSAAQLKLCLEHHHAISWDIVASPNISSHLYSLILRIDPATISRPKGYRLLIRPEVILIEANDPAGCYHGVCTLMQILKQADADKSLPCLEINDWPDFSDRGVMLDISRDKIPSMDTLFRLVDMLASWKINQLQLYTEHTFAYRNHPEVWAKASPVTGEEIIVLDKYCRERFIDLVPNQNSFGHMHRWFEHPRYYPLGELANIQGHNWWGGGSFSLCPIDPGSIDLVQSLYDELLPHFTSNKFNVGCDETFDLGQGRSQEACATQGQGRVYLDFLLKISALVKSHNRTMQFWGDIIMQYPDLIPELPKDIIALEWGYEADHPFQEHGKAFATSGIPFYVCPGTSAWNTIAGRTDNALGNILNAAQNGLQHGAIGLLNTDWGDNGHWQQLPVSYLGYAAGGAYSWCLETNRSLDIPTALSQHAFSDTTGITGNIAYELGNVYKQIGVAPHNSSVLFHAMQKSHADLANYRQDIPEPVFVKTIEAIDQIMSDLNMADMKLGDRELIQRELTLTAQLLRHACQRLIFVNNPAQSTAKKLHDDLLHIMQEYISLWLNRNRQGGLADSLLRFEPARQGYLSFLQ